MYDLHNRASEPRQVWDGFPGGQRHVLAPGERKENVALSEEVFKRLLFWNGEIGVARRRTAPDPGVQVRAAAAPPEPLFPSITVAPFAAAAINVAVVVGGAANVTDEIGLAVRLCDSVGAAPTFFVINDMIAFFDGPAIVCSLHPDKLERWLIERARKGYPAPSEVYAHRRHPRVTKATEDWGGSSGLFSIKVARSLGFAKIMLCGVGMSVDGGHFARNRQWTAAQAFQRAWTMHTKEIAPYARSFSGWTKNLLGAPTAEFLIG